MAAAVTVAVVALAPMAAHADPYTGTPPPAVGGNDLGPRVLGNVQERVFSRSESSAGRGGALALTGSDVLPLTVIGAGALGLGTVLVLKNRRRQEG